MEVVTRPRRMKLYRAVSTQELADVVSTGVLRPAPPSNQGKWFAESAQDAETWGRRLHLPAPFHVLEVEVPDVAADQWYRIPFLDRIGPARYAEIGELASISTVREIPVTP